MSYIILNDGHSIRRISIDSIYYITTHSRRPHFLIVVMEDELLSVPGSLISIQSNFSNAFVRCHRKYLVNTCKIVGFDIKKREMIFDNDKISPITCSRNKFKTVKSEWLATLGEMT